MRLVSIERAAGTPFRRVGHCAGRVERTEKPEEIHDDGARSYRSISCTMQAELSANVGVRGC